MRYDKYNTKRPFYSRRFNTSENLIIRDFSDSYKKNEDGSKK